MNNELLSKLQDIEEDIQSLKFEIQSLTQSFESEAAPVEAVVKLIREFKRTKTTIAAGKVTCDLIDFENLCRDIDGIEKGWNPDGR